MKRDLLSDLCMQAINAKPFPNGQTRLLLRVYNTDRQALAALVNSGAKESETQEFLEQHPIILLHAILDGFYPVASTRAALFAKVQLGSEYEVDFAYCSGNSIGVWWTFIELERPNVPIFTKSGDPSKYLTHAIRQVTNWQAWLADHTEYAYSNLMELVRNSPGKWYWQAALRRPSKMLIVIGRRSALTRETNRLRAQLCDDNPWLEIITYDRLFDDYYRDKKEDLDAAKDEVRIVRELEV